VFFARGGPPRQVIVSGESLWSQGLLFYWNGVMSLGLADRQGDLFDDLTVLCEQRLPEGSIFGLLHRERDRLFSDQAFADLFTDVGRRSVPPSVVATVMVLQRLEALVGSGGGRAVLFRLSLAVRGRGRRLWHGAGWRSFAHTVLVDMRARLAASADPDRIFATVVEVAAKAGLVGRRRAIDSTPLYDAVATMDTVTMIRSAIRGLLRVAGRDLVGELTAALSGCDDYASAAKPVIDWDDRAAREELIDSRAKDAHACLRVLDQRQLDETVEQAARLLATVVGQDLEEGEDGVFRIVRRVAPDRVISTVDPQARHGRKTWARGFDGYKGHAAVDPDSEIITATTVTPGNVGDASVAEDLIADLLGDKQPASGPCASEPSGSDVTDTPAERAESTAEAGPAADAEPVDQGRPEGADPASVYGDDAYGTAAFQQRLHDAGIDSKCKTQQPTAAGDVFTKGSFEVDLDTDTVCPAGQSSRSAAGAAATEWPTSGKPARPAPCASSAPAAARVEPSTSA